MIDISKVHTIYPYDEWCIIEEEFSLENNYRNETIFSQANGFIGTRGTFEENYKFKNGTGLEGNFINGFYESNKIMYGELAFAYTDKSQTMLNVTNAKIIKLFADEEEFSLISSKILEYRRILNMKKGMLTRNILWELKSGKKIEIEINRIVSMKNQNIMAINYKITPRDNVQIEFLSELDGDVENSTRETNSRIDYGPYGRVIFVKDKQISDDNLSFIQETINTKIILGVSATHEIIGESAFNKKEEINENKIGLRYNAMCNKDKTIEFNKYIAYKIADNIEEYKKENHAENICKNAREYGFKNILEDQINFMDKFWGNSDVKINGDVSLQQGIRFNLYHLLQSACRDGKQSVGAKGLSGEGYEGHCFWDTEMYVLPFFIYTNPNIAKSLLIFRYRTLDKARIRAREMSVKKGALYPWRTINGEEASAYFLAGTAQVHINADIAYAVEKYIEVTEDYEFLEKYGAEILIETARFWFEFGDYIENKGGKFCINGVTGPDEFSVLVNNNLYTNMLAKENMENACKAIDYLSENNLSKLKELTEKLKIDSLEYNNWKSAAKNMYIPYDTERQLYLQDDSFLDKKPWDLKNTPIDKFPLLDNHHPMVVYRYQVSKQADLILAMFLQSNKFNKAEKKRNFDYYDKVTAHESSLSACIFSIVANDIGYYDKAYEYFMTTSRLDLDDYHRNTSAGIHVANMAGTYMGIVNGFAGMRIYDNKLECNPKLPKGWTSYSFKIKFKNRQIKVEIQKNRTIYTLIKGEPISIKSSETIIKLNIGRNVEVYK